MMPIRIIIFILNAYSFAILIRMVLAWIPNTRYQIQGIHRFFIVITDPYLNIFKKIPFLRTRNIDFSLIVSILALNTVQVVLLEWLQRGAGSLLLLPIVFASAVLNIIAFCALVLGVVAIIRVILIYMGVSGMFTIIFDHALHPLTSRLFALFSTKRNISFAIQLIICAALMLVIFFSLRLLSAWIFLL